MNELPSHWFQEELAGVPVRFFRPSVPSPHGYACLFLHDAAPDPLLTFPAFTNMLESRGLTLVAPQTGHSWWTDRPWAGFEPGCVESVIVKQLLPELQAKWELKPPRMALLGAGMGGQGALRIAYKHARTFPVIAAINPWIDMQIAHKGGDETLNEIYPNAEAARQDTATLHIHPLAWPPHQWIYCDGDYWPWIEGADRLQSKLAALGVPYEYDRAPSFHGDHVGFVQRLAPQVLDKLIYGLERERLRIL